MISNVFPSLSELDYSELSQTPELSDIELLLSKSFPYPITPFSLFLWTFFRFCLSLPSISLIGLIYAVCFPLKVGLWLELLNSFIEVRKLFWDQNYYLGSFVFSNSLRAPTIELYCLSSYLFRFIRNPDFLLIDALYPVNLFFFRCSLLAAFSSLVFSL